MDITWLGHACVRVRTRQATVVMDPADRSAGFDMGRPTAQVVTISHQHPFHDHAAGVRGKPLVIDGPGEYEILGVQLLGVGAPMPAREGAPALRNTTFVLEAEGLHVAHLGGVAVPPTADEAELLASIDILVIPVGCDGVDPVDAARTVRELEPMITIPVAYPDAAGGAKAGKQKAAPKDPLTIFIESIGLDAEEPTAKLSVQRRSLGEQRRLILLEPARG